MNRSLEPQDFAMKLSRVHAEGVDGHDLGVRGGQPCCRRLAQKSPECRDRLSFFGELSNPRLSHPRPGWRVGFQHNRAFKFQHNRAFKMFGEDPSQASRIETRAPRTTSHPFTVQNRRFRRSPPLRAAPPWGRFPRDRAHARMLQLAAEPAAVCKDTTHNGPRDAENTPFQVAYKPHGWPLEGCRLRVSGQPIRPLEDKPAVARRRSIGGNRKRNNKESQFQSIR